MTAPMTSPHVLFLVKFAVYGRNVRQTEENTIPLLHDCVGTSYRTWDSVR